MILVKYALLLFVLFSVVVPGNSRRKRKTPAEPQAQASGESSVVVPQAGHSGLNQNAPKALGESPIEVPQAGNSGDEIAQNNPEGSDAPQALVPGEKISLGKLRALKREIKHPAEIPFWPPVIGRVYWTEPFNMVSMESFSTRMSSRGPYRVNGSVPQEPTCLTPLLYWAAMTWSRPS